MLRRISAVSGWLVILVASAMADSGVVAPGGTRPADGSPFEELCRDAEGGNAKAQYVLGCCYNGEHGIQKDSAKAAIWFEKAAAQGVADAQYLLGLCYYVGDGVRKDRAAATSWWRKAAEQDHADAEYFLGISYSAGIGVPKSQELAVYWLQKAASLGNAEAAAVLKRFMRLPG